jgi:hypothetical protein
MVEPRAFVLLKSRRQLDVLNPDQSAWTDEDLAAGLTGFCLTCNRVRRARLTAMPRWGLIRTARPNCCA